MRLLRPPAGGLAMTVESMVTPRNDGGEHGHSSQ